MSMMECSDGKVELVSVANEGLEIGCLHSR
jgi:hypothetical protein